MPTARYESSFARASVRASMALTLLAKALANERFPMVPSTPATTRPLRFLPSRTKTTSTWVVPSGCGVKV